MVSMKLKVYIEENIIPKYSNLDKAHQVDHVIQVIKESLDIASDFDVNLDMVYTIAAFHDLGLIINRATHHIEGGILLENDSFIKSYFNIEEILVMKEAIEDHRASIKYEPRSIYGKIINEADKVDTASGIVLRCILFHFNKNEDNSFQTIYPKVRHHLEDKYGPNGYLHNWLETKSVTSMLNDIRELLLDEDSLKEYCLNLYETIV